MGIKDLFNERRTPLGKHYLAELYEILLLAQWLLPQFPKIFMLIDEQPGGAPTMLMPNDSNSVIIISFLAIKDALITKYFQ